MLPKNTETEISCTVNGQNKLLKGLPMTRLLDSLRESLGLTGTKEGCGEGECGACSVIINGQLVNSCLVPISQMNGAQIETIENLGTETFLNPLQKAFLKCGGAQCGICTPGMLMAATHLLRQNACPTRDEIKDALAGNLCRCTGFVKIVDAVESAVQYESKGTHS